MSLQFASFIQFLANTQTHCFSPPQILCRWGCDAAGSSCQRDSGSSGSRMPPHLKKHHRGHSVLVRTQRCACFSADCSAPYFLTRAVQAAGQLSSHHLHDEADPEPQHVPKQRRLGAHVHGEIHHDLLRDQRAERHQSEKGVKEVGMSVIYLRENSDADVLTTGLVDQRVQLLWWKWAAETHHSGGGRGGALKSLVHLVKLVCVWLTQWWLSPSAQEVDLQSAACDGRSGLCRPEQHTHTHID